MEHSPDWRILAACILAGWAVANGGPLAEPFALSPDTLTEELALPRPDLMEKHVYLVNRTHQPVRVDGIEIGLDRRLFKSISMDFQVFSGAESAFGFDKIFYWSEDSTSSWMSGSLLIPARDSIRIFQLRFDRCVRCNGRPTLAGSREIIAPVRFKAGKNMATLYVKGWYLMPRVLNAR